MKLLNLNFLKKKFQDCYKSSAMVEKQTILELYVLVFLLALALISLTAIRLPELKTFTSSSKIEFKDWHDYEAIKLDAIRKGLGEQGRPAYIKDNSLRALERNISLQNGFNGLLSDRISVVRSVADIRNKGCHRKLYPVNLPKVSIVIPFYNEHFSVLVRSVHSLINRSPPELIEEIILVDDCSDRVDLFKKLEDYIAKYFINVKIIRLKARSGLITARLAGARKAKAEVLIFLDSHIEANYNWLPPLLEPIVYNRRTAVCPQIDAIDDKTFEYTAQDEGARGSFNWIFDYKRLPLLPENLVDRTRPFRSPIMAGGLFAIPTKFFWELGGYDEGLDIWGGEQYELSFKIWMCGGELLDAPCSRVGHIYRGERSGVPDPKKGDYTRRNYKRVAEVWMDEYKQYIYDHDPNYAKIETGDLTKQKRLRNDLKCKSFKWFIEEIAFDLVKVFPPIEPPDYANGAIQSVAEPTLCVDALDRPLRSLIGLSTCDKNLTHPEHNQNWSLSGHRDIRIHLDMACLEVKTSGPNADVWIMQCQEEGGNQFWYYDRRRRWIIFERGGNRCLEAVVSSRKLRVNKCRENDPKMQWKFGFVNATALVNFFVDVPDISYAF